jgi:ABC-2 type transport system ATP-binding protein
LSSLATPVIRISGVRKRYGKTVAVDEISYGEVYALQERIGVQLQQAQLQKRIKVREAVHLWAALYRKPPGPATS